jgi:hypothetical protein
MNRVAFYKLNIKNLNNLSNTPNLLDLILI